MSFLLVPHDRKVVFQQKVCVVTRRNGERMVKNLAARRSSTVCNVRGRLWQANQLCFNGCCFQARILLLPSGSSFKNRQSCFVTALPKISGEHHISHSPEDSRSLNASQRALYPRRAGLLCVGASLFLAQPSRQQASSIFGASRRKAKRLEVLRASGQQHPLTSLVAHRQQTGSNKCSCELTSRSELDRFRLGLVPSHVTDFKAVIDVSQLECVPADLHAQQVSTSPTVVGRCRELKYRHGAGCAKFVHAYEAGHDTTSQMPAEALA